MTNIEYLSVFTVCIEKKLYSYCQKGIVQSSNIAMVKDLFEFGARVWKDLGVRTSCPTYI